MIVRRDLVSTIVEKWRGTKKLSLDTETTGLRPYHGDRFFSIIISDGENSEYFNFKPYPGLKEEFICGKTELKILGELFSDPTKTWFIHNAKFDLAILRQSNVEIAGNIHCTKVGARVVYNDHIGYSLDECAERIGLRKMGTVEAYINEHKLYTEHKFEWKKDRIKLKRYDQVPLDIIVPYAKKDALVCYSLGLYQEGVIYECKPELRSLQGVWGVESRLTKTVSKMEERGIRADLSFCELAATFELGRARRVIEEFGRITGHEFKPSPKLYREIFKQERTSWVYTEKGNPSFSSEVLKRFKHPAAKLVIEYNDAKAKANFYNGFLYHADKDGFVHPNLNQDGTASGRFSSSDPNFQNLKKEEGDDLKAEFVVRRAIIPRDGHFFIMPDYDQMEYRLMLDYAAAMVGRKTQLIEMVLSGVDVHQATADIAKEAGVAITRKQAKAGNFATLYGSGVQTLAETLGCPVDEAREIRRAINRGAPEISYFSEMVSNTAKRRRYIHNWLGRRCHFPSSSYTYKAPNYLIQGGCADVVKVAMNHIDEYLKGTDSRLILQVHDELVVEVAMSDLRDVPKEVKRIMETVYPYKYLPLTCGMEWSSRSMADKVEGFPLKGADNE